MFFSNVYKVGNKSRPIVGRFFVLVSYAVCSYAIFVLCKYNSIKYDFPNVYLLVNAQMIVLELFGAVWGINKIHHSYVKMLHVRDVVIDITS